MKKTFSLCVIAALLLASCATKEPVSEEEPVVVEVPAAVAEVAAPEENEPAPVEIAEEEPESGIEAEIETADEVEAEEVTEADEDILEEILIDEELMESEDDSELIYEEGYEIIYVEITDEMEADDIPDDIDIDIDYADEAEEIVETDGIDADDEIEDDADEEIEDDIVEVDETEADEEIEEVEEIEEDDEWYEEELEDEPELVFIEEEYELPEADALLTGTIGEPLIITFETSGWVYLGDLIDTGCIQMETRQNGLFSTTFTFSILDAGEALLEFWAIDPLTGEDVFVHYAVELTEAKLKEPALSAEPVIESVEPVAVPVVPAPATEPAEAATLKQEPAAEESEPAPRTFAPLDTIPFSTFSAAELDAFFTDAENLNYYGLEDMLWYEGQVRENHPSTKDIKRAVACYEQLVKKFPGSCWWKSANERARYLRKYYYL